MRDHNLFAAVFCFVCLFTICLSQEVKSAPQTSKVDYTDYLPKYRTLSEGFLISKIDYTTEDMIVFFRYIANQNNDVITFYGSNRENTWKLTTANQSKTSEAYTVTRLASVQNIRINDEAKIERLEASAQERISARKGDIITCEVHFKMMPRTVRTVHLVGGDLAKSGAYRFNCNDILLKSKDSKILGTEEQMKASIQRFYSKQELVNYPDINSVTTLEEQKALKKKNENTERVVNPLAKSLEPIDYMPKSIASIEDMACNERVILTNVYFHDNKAEFAGRIKAMKTINLIVDYLNFHPKAKIVLHGHTDVFGNSFRNLELSQKRVLIVKRTITSKGINENRIITVHHGGAQPLIQYKNGSELNRRVEAEVLCSGVMKNPAINTRDSMSSVK
ncbi:OmpA family protein [Aureispira anguillae]|uniref:OmpA family protein n=1 Tax=Aureispira anguillae TaxID=2864201 RepID=A0A916DQK2_9BACT|nr:OmpA family protein [Aureispira anguillae]BDS10135.1 OmpA family protein [Aureispira anguillae]